MGTTVMGTMKTIGRGIGRFEPILTENRLLAAVTALALLVQGMAERARSRRALSALSDEQLKDIGLSRSDAFREASRPFWD
jgi:uncharacterized protein YjiS (DUF1127 family)